MAKSFFTGEWGLPLQYEDDCCLEFSNDLGIVKVLIIDDDDDKLDVKLTTREFEHQIEQFLSST